MIRELPEDYQKILDGFSCPKNKDVESFLISKAAKFEKRHNARTYLIFERENVARGIIGYFTISFKEITITEDIKNNISKNKIKKYDGFSGTPEEIRVLLIAQLAKNAAITNNKLNLGSMLNHVYSVLEQVQHLVGGRVILIECNNNKKLIDLYKNHEFEYLQKDSQLVQLTKVFDPQRHVI